MGLWLTLMDSLRCEQICLVPSSHQSYFMWTASAVVDDADRRAPASRGCRAERYVDFAARSAADARSTVARDRKVAGIGSSNTEIGQIEKGCFRVGEDRCPGSARRPHSLGSKR